jgi:hypothetical protein
MSHADLLVKLDALIALSGDFAPFSKVDLALIALRSEINSEWLPADKPTDDEFEAEYTRWEEEKGFAHACTYAAY